MTALFYGAKDAHQDGLTVGASLASVAVAVFADDYGRADCSLGGVVVERNVGLFEKRKQIFLVASKPLDQPLGVLAFPRRVDQLL